MFGEIRYVQPPEPCHELCGFSSHPKVLSGHTRPASQSAPQAERGFLALRRENDSGLVWGFLVCLSACLLVFLLSLRVGALHVADPMARGSAQRPPPASVPDGPASSGPRRPATPSPRPPATRQSPPPPCHLVTSLSVDATGRATGLERWGPSASPHPGVATAAPSGPRRARPCGDRRSDGAQKFGEERRGRGRERARPPPGHAPCPPRNAPAGPRERNALLGLRMGARLGAELRVGGALGPRRCGQKSTSEARPAA